jgi:hypothetical protein
MRVRVAEPLRGAYALVATARGHPDVGDDDVGRGRLDGREQRLEVLAGSDDLDVVPRPEQPLQSLANEQVVLGEDDADRQARRIRRSEGAERRDRAHLLAGDLGDELEISVVVEHGKTGQLPGGRNEEVENRHLAVVEGAAFSKRMHDVDRTAPHALGDRTTPKVLELVTAPPEVRVVLRFEQELEPDSVTGRDGSEPE